MLHARIFFTFDFVIINIESKHQIFYKKKDTESDSINFRYWCFAILPDSEILISMF